MEFTLFILDLQTSPPDPSPCGEAGGEVLKNNMSSILLLNDFYRFRPVVLLQAEEIHACRQMLQMNGFDHCYGEQSVCADDSAY